MLIGKAELGTICKAGYVKVMVAEDITEAKVNDEEERAQERAVGQTCGERESS